MNDVLSTAVSALPPASDQGASLTDSVTISLLPNHGIVRVAGEDAAAFLQEHLTNDMQKTTADIQLSAYCNAKGRVQVLFSGWRGDNTYYLISHDKSLLPALVKRWSMLASLPRASGKGLTAGIKKPDISIQDLSDSWSVLGLTGAQREDFLQSLSTSQTEEGLPEWSSANGHDMSLLVGLPASLVAVLGFPGEADARLRQMSAENWALQEIRSGRPSVVSATGEAFVPQMINLQVLHGIDFQKGCYPGQEIVARMQYRGTLKRSMYRLQAPVGGIAPGDKLVAGDDRDAGTVVAVAPTSDSTSSELLAVLKREALAKGRTITFETPTGESVALSVMPLPYALPDAEA